MVVAPDSDRSIENVASIIVSKSGHSSNSLQREKLAFCNPRHDEQQDVLLVVS